MPGPGRTPAVEAGPNRGHCRCTTTTIHSSGEKRRAGGATKHPTSSVSRWAREQRESESRQAQRERERRAEEERASREEQIRLASRTPDQVAADEAAEAQARAEWEAGAEQREREDQARLARTYRRRDDPYGTFGT